MEILEIDFDLTLQDISDYTDKWSLETFGTLDKTRYYNLSPDGRYLYGVKEGAALNEAKALEEHLKDVIIRIRRYTQRLKGIGLNQHLTWEEREHEKAERQKLYDEYLNIMSSGQENRKNRKQAAKNKIDPSEQSRDELLDSLFICEETEKERLKAALDRIIKPGTKGKGLALPLLICFIEGKISQKPTFTQVQKIYDAAGNRQGYDSYFHIEKYQKEEIESIKKALGL